jgi:hypothetical protein
VTDPRPVCRVCKSVVEPGGAGIVTAVELVHGQDFGGEPAEVVDEGERIFFHEDHLPAGSGHFRIVDS